MNCKLQFVINITGFFEGQVYLTDCMVKGESRYIITQVYV